MGRRLEYPGGSRRLISHWCLVSLHCCPPKQVHPSPASAAGAVLAWCPHLCTHQMSRGVLPLQPTQGKGSDCRTRTWSAGGRVAPSAQPRAFCTFPDGAATPGAALKPGRILPGEPWEQPPSLLLDPLKDEASTHTRAAEEDHAEGLHDPRDANDPCETEEEDDPKDILQAGQVDTHKSAHPGSLEREAAALVRRCPFPPLTPHLRHPKSAGWKVGDHHKAIVAHLSQSSSAPRPYG